MDETQIKAALKHDLKPCRCLAPEWVYTLLFTLCGLLPSIAFLLFGAHGWQTRPGSLAALIPLASAILAYPLGLSLARSMTPGSPPAFPDRWILGWLILLAAGLFSSTRHQPGPAWSTGESHCLRWGVGIAALMLLPIGLLLLRGAMLRLGFSFALAAFAAGLAGLLGLESSCHNAGLWHILMSHVSVPFLLTAAALPLALVVQRLRR